MKILTYLIVFGQEIKYKIFRFFLYMILLSNKQTRSFILMIHDASAFVESVVH